MTAHTAHDSATPAEADPSPCHTAELLVHVARLVHGAASDPSLTPAQWTALRYFASANRFSRTPSAFSEFHATTRGTASQTVKSLIAMGLLVRKANEADGRSTLIEVTAAGHAKLAGDPLADLSHCVRAMPAAERAMFAGALARLGSELARLRAAPTFGQCSECGHCDREAPGGVFCRCTQSSLSGDDMGSLCIDFAPTAPRLR